MYLGIVFFVLILFVICCFYYIWADTLHQIWKIFKRDLFQIIFYIPDFLTVGTSVTHMLNNLIKLLRSLNLY